MLSADSLRMWLAHPDDLTPMREALMKVLKATDLVQRSELDIIDALSHKALAEIAEVLRAMWADDAEPSPDFDLAAQFDALVAALTIGDAEPRWCLPTTLLAALFPESFPPVRHAIYREQARWMAPGLRLDRTPTGGQFLRLRKMVKLVQQKLAQQALVARELFDVWDFMWETLRPKARRAMLS
jgi:BMFP domain-containing protein YqiC